MKENIDLNREFDKNHVGKYDYRISCDCGSNPITYGSNQLYQLGRLHCNRHTVIPVHTQLNYVELTIATDGRATVYTNGEGVQIEAGDIYVSFAGDFHAITSDSREPLKYDFVSFQSEDPAIVAALEVIIADHHDASARIIRNSLIGKLVSEAINELASSDGFTDRVMTALLDRIIIGVIRTFNSTDKERIQSSIGEEELLCLKLMNYIDNHIYSINNLKELVSITNYTYNYMSNLFKRVTGDTLLNYYRNRRFEAATLLLKSGQFTISQIAQMLNYSSIYSFSLAFKKKYGYSPTEAKHN